MVELDIQTQLFDSRALMLSLSAPEQTAWVSGLQTFPELSLLLGDL